MKKLKINLDRPSLEKEYIESKQDFNQVLTGLKQLKPPIWKNPWFYGPVGVASLALLISLSSINSKEKTHDETSTLNVSANLPEDTECIHQPKKNIDENFVSFEVDPSKEQTITLPSGTSVFIPKGSLTPISLEKKVEIKIREFDDKMSSFVAGIPMDYKNDKTFESAGMIEIRGFQDGKEVLISPSKPIKVSMVLSKNPNDFTFWQLDENQKEWKDYPANFVSDKKVSPINPSEKINYLENQIKITDSEITKNGIIIKEIIEPTRIEYYLPIEGNQRFDLAFDQKEFPELEKFKGMEFEVVSKKSYDKSFAKKTWTSVDLTKESENYFATFSSKNEKFRIGVRPVLDGKKKDQAESEFEKSFTFYKNKKQDLENERKALILKRKAQQAKYDQLILNFEKVLANDNNTQLTTENKLKKSEIAISSVGGFKADFSINSFGVYNCDKPITYPEAISNDYVFSFYNNDPVDVVSAHVFDEKKDVRYSFGVNSRHNLDNLGCYERNPNTLVVIDKEGRLGYFLSFNSNAIKNGIVKLTLINKKDENLDFIQKLINEKPADS